MLEIGVVVNDQFNDGKYALQKVSSLDVVNNLKVIVSAFDVVNARVPKDTNLLILSATGFNTNTIKSNMKKSVEFVIKRHKRMAEL